MDMELSEQVMSLLVTVVALIIVVPLAADMYFHGLPVAAPRDSAALVLFAVVRWFVGRTMRSATPAPDSTED
jgi:hypothetical protein